MHTTFISESTSASAPNATKPNGIDVGALAAAATSIRADAAKGLTRWAVESRWVGGTRADHQVRGYEIGGAAVGRAFTIRSDEPLELCGTNQFPNPQEYLLAAINACMMVGYAAGAAMMGIRLTKLEIEITGDIDLAGFLGLDGETPAGYPSLEQSVRIAGDGTPEQFARLHETVLATSPNYFNITRAVPTRSRLMVG